MQELWSAAAGAPFANLLIVVGAVFLLVAVGAQLTGKIDPGKNGRILAGGIGAIFVLIGIGIHVATPRSDGEARTNGDGNGTGTGGSPPPQYSSVDLVANAPSAAWKMSEDGPALSWGGSSADPRGFAIWVDGASMEDGSHPSRVLETHPQWVENGQIVGDFRLPRRIRDGDRFHTSVGFLQGGGGAVTFVVRALGGGLPNPQTVAEVNDSGQNGQLREVSADLTLVAGADTIRLLVKAGPSPGQDWAVWVNPVVDLVQ